jgi:hypothetical protein
MKSFLRKLFLVDRVQNKWARSLIGAIITTLILTSLGWTAKTVYETVKLRRSEAQNISEEEALAIAKTYVGAPAVKAIPFRNISSDEQYIAVAATPPGCESATSDAACGRMIYLLEGIDLLETTDHPRGTDLGYHKVPDLDMLARDFGIRDPGLAYKGPAFGVLDIDDDGNKELYSILREVSAGSSYEYEIKVYTSIEKELYWLRVKGEYTSPAQLTYSSDIERNARIYHWMLKMAGELSYFQSRGPGESAKMKPYQDAVLEWLRDHGRGFYRGPLDIHEFRGKLPTTVGCSVDDGTYKWFSFFKGPTVGHNKSENSSFVIYVPYSEYGWVDRMVVGKRYLWLGIVKDGKIIVFDKENPALKTLAVPELASLGQGKFELKTESGYTLPETLYGGFDVSDSSLYVVQGTNNQKRVRLTLPDYVAEDEFANATTCILGVTTK